MWLGVSIVGALAHYLNELSKIAGGCSTQKGEKVKSEESKREGGEGGTMRQIAYVILRNGDDRRQHSDPAKH